MGNYIRIYHATLALFSLLAYISGEWGIIHSYIGYCVAIIILFRLFWAFSKNRQLGLTTFSSNLKGLNFTNIFTHPAVTKILILGIATSVICVTLTGIFIDQGEALGIKNASITISAYADDDNDSNHNKKEDNDSLLNEAHEFFANTMLFFVFLHVTYLFLFKNSLVRFMLFLPKKNHKK